VDVPESVVVVTGVVVVVTVVVEGSVGDVYVEFAVL
jgi:hypothetical protein